MQALSLLHFQPKYLNAHNSLLTSQKDRTVFVDVITDPNENVFPMIPAGGAHCDMLLSGRDEMVSKDETDLNAV